MTPTRYSARLTDRMRYPTMTDVQRTRTTQGPRS